MILALLLGGCASRKPGGTKRKGRPAHFTWARTPAAGTPSTCPEDAVDYPGVDGRNVPSTDQARCSYADGARDLVHVRGKVLQEVPGNLARGMADVVVVFLSVRDDGTDGPPLARTTTDAQGAFSLKVQAKPGHYALVAGDGRWPVDVAKKGTRTFDDVQVLVPAP